MQKNKIILEPDALGTPGPEGFATLNRLPNRLY